MTHLSRRALGATAVLTATLLATTPASAVSTAATDGGRHTVKVPTSVGFGGAVSTVDPEASAAALEVLKEGGNATDAAVAAAATLGVTEPYSSGIGGGGYFVHYDAATGRVQTIDGRETAPASMPHDAFIDPSTGKPYNFTPELVTSGVSVGVPGSLATWQRALDRWGTMSLGRHLPPGRSTWPATASWSTRRSASRRWRTRCGSTPSGRPAGSSCRAVTRRRSARSSATPTSPRRTATIARRGISYLYDGALGHQISRVVQHPPKTASTTLPVPTGLHAAVRPARATGRSTAGPPTSATAGTTSTAWRRRRPVARPSARR